MTFDNVPWVATMKKNEHYFPTMEIVKDKDEELGWKKIVHEADKKGMGEEVLEGAMVDVEGAVEGEAEPARVV